MCGCHERGRGKEEHQQAIMTRWCCVWLLWFREKRKRAPKSCNDLLVLVWTVWSREKLPMSLYDSLVLVVAVVIAF